jgi:pyridoxal phosphate enzyme (YggS family)
VTKVTGFTPALVAERLSSTRDRIRAAGGSDDVVIVAVTKGFGVEAPLAAARAGCTHIGENYAQELMHKMELWPTGQPRPVVHMIGTVQTNKVNLLAGLVDVWETVDRRSLVDVLARRAPGASVLVQVNATGEQGNGGCQHSECSSLVAYATECGLVVDGIMAIGPTEGGPEAARPAFRMARALADDLGLRTRSMGMSADLEVAIEEGSTEVRVGTALFGERPRRHS